MACSVLRLYTGLHQRGSTPKTGASPFKGQIFRQVSDQFTSHFRSTKREHASRFACAGGAPRPRDANCTRAADGRVFGFWLSRGLVTGDILLDTGKILCANTEQYPAGADHLSYASILPCLSKSPRTNLGLGNCRQGRQTVKSSPVSQLSAETSPR